jgi:cobyrinic acid a,c-diamide synthase
LVHAVEQYCGLPVVGTIPRNEHFSIAERHLGLVPFTEAEAGPSVVDHIADAIEGNLDIDAIVKIAGSEPSYTVSVRPRKEKVRGHVRARIAVFYDKAFNFYYPENLEALVGKGAELTFVDSFADGRLPHVDGLYIGGGFPEIHVEELAHNRSLMNDIALAIEEGLPTYAECGGLMYLCRGIRVKGRLFAMTGILPVEVGLSNRPQGHGYVEAKVTGDNPYFHIGTKLRGHEFHHSKIHYPAGLRCALEMERGQGIDGRFDGIVYKNLFASYLHLHALGTPAWAQAFVRLAAERRRSRPTLLNAETGG